jgi:hypothetical protein
MSVVKGGSKVAGHFSIKMRLEHVSPIIIMDGGENDVKKIEKECENIMKYLQNKKRDIERQIKLLQKFE